MAKRTMMFKSILIALISLISLSKCNPLSETTNTKGFTIDLIHRDSPQSPSYDPSLSPSERLANALRRSFDRVHRFKSNPSSSKSPQSDLILSNAEYLMNYSIGTPPIPSLAIADTGSDITWTQCQPCTQCFKQKLPLFEPKISSTYKNISCSTNTCVSYHRRSSCSDNNASKNCLYTVAYGDGSFTNGDLATDTITLDSSDRKRVSFTNFTFGCGFKNGGTFNGGESGIVGLGGGKLSLVRQLGQGKFSHCLVSKPSSSSKLNFGANAEVSGSGVVTTPLVKKFPETFYYLTLEAISVGDQRLEFGEPRTREDGNIIIDSGTTVTLLPSEFFVDFWNAMNSFIHLKQIRDPLRLLNLCYYSEDDIKNVPDVTVHFKGADVKWKYENLFVRTSNVSVCVAVAPVIVVDSTIYGNLAQTNFLVGYDLVKRTVSFKPTDCGK